MQLFSPLLILGLAAMGLAQATPEFGPIAGTCGETCFSGVAAKAAEFGCGSAADTVCLCNKPDFHNGVRDCSSKTCAPEIQGLVTEYVNNKFCVGIPVPAVDKAADATTTTPITLPTPTPTTTEPAPTTTTPAIVSSETTSAQSSSTVQSSSASTSAPVSSSSSVTSSSVSSAPERTQSASSTNAASSTIAPTTTASPSPTAVPAASDGMSMESKIGVGVGVAAAAIALIALVACLVISRRRKARNAQTHNTVMQKLKISDPISGGRTFANDSRNRQYEAGENELETRSKRYEEYEPRVSPRNMV